MLRAPSPGRFLQLHPTRDATGDGVIVGQDGFRATTFSPEDFAGLAERLGVEAEIYEVDSSSVFCKILRF